MMSLYVRFFILSLIALNFQNSPAYAEKHFELHGINLRTQKEITQKAGDQGIVVAFLSARCPCSDSHVEELRALSEDFTQFTFVGVHSNADETTEEAQKYFNKQDLPFPILQDQNNKWANQFKAFKTPHVFVFSPQGEVLYQGGVSNSRVFTNADKKFLRQALSDVQAHRKVAFTEGRTLGCSIARVKK